MSSTASSSPDVPIDAVTPDPRTVIGPLFVGTIINWMLMGTLILQLYMYQTQVRRVKDRLGIRILVYVIFVLDAVQTVLGTQQTWFFAVDNWNKPTVFLAVLPWASTSIPIMCALVSGLVQFFYAWRIWTLSTHIIMKIVVVLIVLVSLTQATAAIVASILISITRTYEELAKQSSLIDIWLAGSFVTDILIAGCMLWLLFKARSNTPWKTSNDLLGRLIINTIQTGVITVICAGIDLALFVHFTQENYHLVPAYILGKLYSNSFLATLNNRGTFRSDTSMTSSSINKSRQTTNSIPMRVQITRKTDRVSDGDALDSTTEWSERTPSQGALKDSPLSSDQFVRKDSTHVIHLSPAEHGEAEFQHSKTVEVV